MGRGSGTRSGCIRCRSQAGGSVFLSSLRWAFPHLYSLLQCLGQKLQFPEVLSTRCACCESQEPGFTVPGRSPHDNLPEKGQGQHVEKAAEVYLELGPLPWFLVPELGPWLVPCKDREAMA